PKGAEWAKSPIFIDDVYYRSDGAGYLNPGFYHLFNIDANGGNAQQLTTGDFDPRGKVSFDTEGKVLYFSANRHKNHALKPSNSEIYSLDMRNQSISAVTDREGPDWSPRVSPNG
ncbi:DPP IV N-terminal domain-containing protein, partial [Pseudoalteromonas sp. S1731]|uniref:TolB family protein n=1 Tax=Pseudoalteromonas sp. S1731 TaxID=579515 RepID=UPI001486FB82